MKIYVNNNDTSILSLEENEENDDEDVLNIIHYNIFMIISRLYHTKQNLPAILLKKIYRTAGEKIIFDAVVAVVVGTALYESSATSRKPVFFYFFIRLDIDHSHASEIVS